MKKQLTRIAAILLAMITAISLAACGDSSESAVSAVESDNGNVYARDEHTGEGNGFAEGDEYVLKTGVYYYLNGDEDEESIYFFSANDQVVLGSPVGETIEMTYYVSGRSIYISHEDGFSVELWIVNNYTLGTSSGEVYVWQPD